MAQNQEMIKPMPADVARQASDMVDEIMKLISPYSTALTPEQRKKLSKASNKTFSFIVKGQEYSEKNPQFMPGFVSTEEFKSAMESYKLVLNLRGMSTQLAGIVNDTAMVNSSGVYSIALDFYKSVQQASKKSFVGAKEIYKDLAARFPGRKKKKPTPVVNDSTAPTELKKVA